MRMNCLKPIDAWFVRDRKTANGKRCISFRPPSSLAPSNVGGDYSIRPDILLPCGKCVLCRDGQRKQWINRLIAETFDNDASFLTLTIDNDHYLPPTKKPIQDFLKRFRISCKRSGKAIPRFKYFFVNEFGSKSARLHYHAIFFGVDLLRDPFFGAYLATHKVDSRGCRYPVWASRFIERLWPFGFNSVDRCSDRSIRYVAKYISKSSYDEDAESRAYFPQWHLYSQRIGTRYFLAGDSLTPFGRSVFSSGRLLLSRDGFPSRPPKFLDRYAELYEPDLYNSVKASRRAFARNRKTDWNCIRGRADSINQKLDLSRRKEIL